MSGALQTYKLAKLPNENEILDSGWAGKERDCVLEAHIVAKGYHMVNLFVFLSALFMSSTPCFEFAPSEETMCLFFGRDTT
jgi:hypothetical protein